MLNVLFVPSDRSLRAERMMEFGSFVRESYGGQIFRLFKLKKPGVEKLEERLLDRSQSSGSATVAEVLICAPLSLLR